MNLDEFKNLLEYRKQKIEKKNNEKIKEGKSNVFQTTSVSVNVGFDVVNIHETARNFIYTLGGKNYPNNGQTIEYIIENDPNHVRWRLREGDKIFSRALKGEKFCSYLSKDVKIPDNNLYVRSYKMKCECKRVEHHSCEIEECTFKTLVEKIEKEHICGKTFVLYDIIYWEEKDKKDVNQKSGLSIEDINKIYPLSNRNVDGD